MNKVAVRPITILLECHGLSGFQSPFYTDSDHFI